jgi:CopG family nickel-responsive transcriptional regulator
LVRIKISDSCYQLKTEATPFTKILFAVKYTGVAWAGGSDFGNVAVRRIEMKGIERIGVSLERKLLSAFDKLIAKQGYQSRSEAIRDLVRERIGQERLANPEVEAVGTVLLVYEHHSTKLMEKLAGLQHSHVLQTISSMHIHLDEHDCLEVIVLKGKVAEINKVAEKIISLKGVKLGRINLVPTQADIPGGRTESL